MDNYARTVSIMRGRCFRWLYDDQGKPNNCSRWVIASGWLQVGTKWYQVDACAEHSAQLRNRSSLAQP
jgi:hypothetical protein